MRWQAWMPSAQEISNAAQLRRGAYAQTTMQQALGMIVLLGLTAGLLPFVMNWIMAARADSVLPLARALEMSNGADWNGSFGLRGLGVVNPAAWQELVQTIAGMEQPLPGWLAGGLSAFGEWLNWPLSWLAAWIVYGAAVMVANKGLGGEVTLQRFFGATGFAAAPLLLTGLSPIPCLGALASLAGIGWSLAVYVRANSEVSGLPLPRAAAAVLLPLPVLALLILLFTGLLALPAAIVLV